MHFLYLVLTRSHDARTGDAMAGSAGQVLPPATRTWQPRMDAGSHTGKLARLTAPRDMLAALNVYEVMLGYLCEEATPGGRPGALLPAVCEHVWLRA